VAGVEAGKTPEDDGDSDDGWEMNVGGQVRKGEGGNKGLVERHRLRRLKCLLSANFGNGNIILGASYFWTRRI